MPPDAAFAVERSASVNRTVTAKARLRRAKGISVFMRGLDVWYNKQTFGLLTSKRRVPGAIDHGIA